MHEAARTAHKLVRVLSHWAVGKGRLQHLPVCSDELRIGNLLHVQGQRQGHNVPREPIHNGPCLQRANSDVVQVCVGLRC